MQNHKKIFARKKDNVNFTQSTNLVNLKKKNMDRRLLLRLAPHGAPEQGREPITAI